MFFNQITYANRNNTLCLLIFLSHIVSKVQGEYRTNAILQPFQNMAASKQYSLQLQTLKQYRRNNVAKCTLIAVSGRQTNTWMSGQSFATSESLLTIFLNLAYPSNFNFMS